MPKTQATAIKEDLEQLLMAKIPQKYATVQLRDEIMSLFEVLLQAELKEAERIGEERAYKKIKKIISVEPAAIIPRTKEHMEAYAKKQEIRQEFREEIREELAKLTEKEETE